MRTVRDFIARDNIDSTLSSSASACNGVYPGESGGESTLSETQIKGRSGASVRSGVLWKHYMHSNIRSFTPKSTREQRAESLIIILPIPFIPDATNEVIITSYW